MILEKTDRVVNPLDETRARQPAISHTKQLMEFVGNSAITDIRIACDIDTLSEIIALRKIEYRNIYPEMDLDNDPLDQQGLVLFTRDASGLINSTARLGFDGPLGLPEDEFLKSYRDAGKRMIEWGRFIIVDGDMLLLKRYYRSIYGISKNLGVDAVVMAMKPKDISLHRRLVGIKVVEEDMGITYGGPFSLACVVWEISQTKKSFFKWIGSTE